MTTVRAHIAPLGPWVLWPPVSYERRQLRETPAAPRTRVVETLTVSVLALSIVVTRDVWREGAA